MRVLLADDHTIVREGIRLLLSRNPEIIIVAEVADGRSAVEQALALCPDVVVMDIMMPDMDGILATKKIKEKVPHVKIIALSMYADKKFITEMLQAGASGFLLKDCASTELLEAIRSAVAGEIYLGPSISGIVAKLYIDAVSDPPEEGHATLLSRRETEILRKIAEGYSNREIGELLHLSAKTVGTHRRNIMSKLQIYSVAELARYAVKTGIIQES